MTVYDHIIKGLPMLDVNEHELRLLLFVTAHGQNGRWEVLQGPTISDGFLVHMGNFGTRHDRRTIRRTLNDLVKKEWLVRETSDQGRPVFVLTKRLVEDCERSLLHRKVRSAIGLVAFLELWEDGAHGCTKQSHLLQLIHERAEAMTSPGRYADRLRAVVRDWGEMSESVQR